MCLLRLRLGVRHPEYRVSREESEKLGPPKKAPMNNWSFHIVDKEREKYSRQ
jgi:hypothetical protein